MDQAISTPSGGPEATVRGYLEALADHDLSRCMEFYAEDATLVFFTTLRGKAAIEQWHRERFASNLQILRVDEIRAGGDTVNVDLAVTTKKLVTVKIASLLGRATIQLEAGKIKRIAFGLQTGGVR